ncbi:MAG: hypothetical protein JSV25_08520 [Spirochaetota bacterium]|nr:MAG: hypothetical protein JSV25_08520 [Spirochaetota bacterium]
MILIAISGLLLLIGFSLFIAVLGQYFLKKHAKKVVKERGPKFSERDYRERYRLEYEEKLRETAVQEAGAGEGTVPARTDYALPVARERGGAGKWVLISLGISIVILLGFYISYRQWGEALKGPRLYFCEDVNYEKLRPINRSDTFTRGNVTVFIKAKRTIDTARALVTIYKLETGGRTSYYSRKIPVKPDWTSFSFRVLFDKIGTYSVTVLDEEGALIAEKNIIIVPDSYAYRTVIGE